MSIQKVHLLVLVHGMWGTPNHLYALSDVAKSTYPNSTSKESDSTENEYELDVLTAETNQTEHTYDGIDWGGERVIEEIRSRINTVESSGTKRVTRFSMTGYSLGGLLARYVIGALHSTHFFDTIEPVNFNTIATPHIGMPRYPHFVSTMAFLIGPKLLGRTGQQFFGTDKFNGPDGKSLLECLSDPEMIFFAALKLFKNVVIFANAVNDKTVPYVTAAIETEDPFLSYQTNGMEVTYVADYDPVVKSYYIPPIPPAQPPPPKRFSAAYWKSLGKPIPIPPPLRFKFPYNILVITALPLIFPIFFSLAITRLTLESRRSNARIKLLDSERQSDSSRMEYVSTLFRGLEKDMDDAMADLMDRSGSMTPDAEGESQVLKRYEQLGAGASTSTEVELKDESDKKSTRSSKKCGSKEPPPLLTATQIQMAKHLNTLPQLQKKLVFIDNVMNSHAAIIARDAQRWKDQERGLGVVRCWADGFEL